MKKLVFTIITLAIVSAFAANKPTAEQMAEAQRMIDASKPTPEQLKEAQKLVDNFNSPESQKAIADAMNELLEQRFDVQTQAVPEALLAGGKPANRVLIFISASMPLETVRNYIDAAKPAGLMADASTEFVLRGTIGKNPALLQPTMDYISMLLCGVPHAELDGRSCKQANINIDPPLFREYDVTRVPTIIVETDNGSYKHVGAMPLSYIKEKIK